MPVLPPFTLLFLFLVLFGNGGRQDAPQAANRLAMPDAKRAAVAGAQVAPHVDPLLAGKYYMGDGLGTNISLELREDGTFSAVWVGCLGVYGRAQGRWAVTGDRVNFVNIESSEMLKDYLRSARIVGEGASAALVLDRDEDMYKRWGRSRHTALQRGPIDEPW